MPFIVAGIVILIAGIYFSIQSRRQGDPDGKIGSIGLIIAGVLLILIFGFLFKFLATL